MLVIVVDAYMGDLANDHHRASRTYKSPSVSPSNCHRIMSSVSDSSEIENGGPPRPTVYLTFDNILDIAAFCAGAFNFRIFLNVALSCKEIHATLKTVLDEPVLVWDDDSIPGEPFFGSMDDDYKPNIIGCDEYYKDYIKHEMFADPDSYDIR